MKEENKKMREKQEALVIEKQAKEKELEKVKEKGSLKSVKEVKMKPFTFHFVLLRPSSLLGLRVKEESL